MVCYFYSSQCIVNFSSNGLKYHLKKRAGHCQETEAEAGGKLSPTEEEGPTSQNQVETGESGGKIVTHKSRGTHNTEPGENRREPL